MPKSNKDIQELLNAFASLVAGRGMYTKEFLLENLKVLDQEVCRKSFDWTAVAERTNFSRHEIYRWYHDTFQRNLFGSVSHEDVMVIRAEIEKALKHNIPLDRNYQALIKERLSKDYHRNSFTVAFNNQKKIMLAKLEEKMLKIRRAASRKSEHKRKQKEESAAPQKFELATDI